jgi:hypothetical protein
MTVSASALLNELDGRAASTCTSATASCAGHAGRPERGAAAVVRTAAVVVPGPAGPASTEYNMQTSVSFDGDLSVEALTAALGDLVTRHEVLRTQLVADAYGVPHQVIDPPGPFDLPIVDLAGQPDPLTAMSGSPRSGSYARSPKPSRAARPCGRGPNG